MRILICKRARLPSAILVLLALLRPRPFGLLYIHAQVKSQQIIIAPVWRARRFDLLIIDSPRDRPAYFHTVSPSECAS